MPLPSSFFPLPSAYSLFLPPLFTSLYLLSPLYTSCHLLSPPVTKVERDFDAFLELHRELSSELLTVPTLPGLTLGDLTGLAAEALGAQLAQYLTRVHVTLANQGLFSPRLLRFLGVNFEQIQVGIELQYV